jgi:hypothetical protein
MNNKGNKANKGKKGGDKQDYLKKKRSRGNFKKNFGGKKFKVSFKQEEPVEDITNIIEERDEGISKDLVKIGKYWEGMNLIEPKVTKDKIVVLEQLGCFIAIVDDMLKIFDLNDLSLKRSIKQVRINFYPKDEETFNTFVFNSKRNEIICAMSNSSIRVFDFNTGKSLKFLKVFIH